MINKRKALYMSLANDWPVDQYDIGMNIAVGRAFGALRVVVPRREVERDSVLQRALRYG